jgi:hypothetical protein
MPTTLLARPAAPTIRKSIRTRYREYLIRGEWVRTDRTERVRIGGSVPMVSIVRRETVYREPIGTRGEKSHVTFHVSGELAREYLAACLPTAVVRADENGTILAVWYY